MKKAIFTLCILSGLMLISCSKKGDFNYYYYSADDFKLLSQYLNIPSQPDDYTVNLPGSLKNAGLFPRALSNDRAVLGRVLFYDKKLSKDGSTSCASCHKQEYAFGDNAPTSKGVNNTLGDRNSISLSSITNFSAYYGTNYYGTSAILFFWDNRAKTSIEQCTASMTNPKEMNAGPSDIEAAVKSQPFYNPLFSKAYGEPTISSDRIKECISEFVNSMGSYNSRFDQEATKVSYGYTTDYLNSDFSGFNASENRGKTVYEANCASCHSPNISRPVLGLANNGLTAETVDKGVGGISSISSELGCFKVPTLRNITLTAPYMHDGSFKTLEEVIEHYSSGIQAHPNLSTQLKDPATGKPKQMNFTTQQKQDLLAFLGTLRDDVTMGNSRFSDPFKH
jgi:cytochrome c peroxidase